MRAHLLLLVLLWPAFAAVEPVVLAIDGNDIYVDVGAKDGAGAGSELELLHEVVAKDPRTGATLRDRFALGTLTIAKSGDRISVAHAEPALAARVIAGDRVRLVSAKRTFVDPWRAQVDASRLAGAVQTRPATTAPDAPAVDHVALAGTAWQDTLGKSPEQRVARWQQLLVDDPKSTYRKLVELEISSLTAQIKARDAAIARARSVARTDRNPRIEHLVRELAGAAQGDGEILSVASLPRAVPGRPIELAFLVRRPDVISKAWLFVKPEGEPGYRRIELAADGDAYLRGRIDAAAVKAGTLGWYVEMATAPDRDAVPVLGSEVAPMTIEIDANVEEDPVYAGRSHIDTHLDYVDFDGKLADGFDQYYQAELDFTYRFIEPVYAVRLGFGTLSGVGGPKDVIDADPMNACRDTAGTYRCRQVDFSYVYAEVEFRLRPNVALMVRPQAGILTTDANAGQGAGRCKDTDDLAGCDFDAGYGARARMRFGSELGTNLVIGASFTSNVGTLLEAAYNWQPAPKVPVQLSVQVTDLPVPEDFGVRLIGDVGYRSWSWFYPSLRLSYQARDIDHGGVSGGVALNFDW
ncbi:MAG: hypothetical protein SFX73_24515 [Kofleriaceae bacterium]|nr:hypothetical protein [Kofleriaceae bacterium]